MAVAGLSFGETQAGKCPLLLLSMSQSCSCRVVLPGTCFVRIQLSRCIWHFSKPAWLASTEQQPHVSSAKCVLCSWDRLAAAQG